MSQEAFGLEVGVTRQAVNGWFSTGSISKGTLRRIAEYIDRPAEEILRAIDGEQINQPDIKALGELRPAPYEPSSLISIPELNVAGSMGPGALVPDHVEVVRRIVVDPAHLSRKVGYTSKASLQFITGYGDSMEPTFSDGDVLLVDAGIYEVRIDAVYVLERENEIFIKRLQRRPDGSLLMISDNKNYQPFAIERDRLGEYKVRGRVILAWNAKRL
ncbi:MAG TPA: LexA family transcriptional regulator [Nevskia sp.]|nr:LexA family transcriptional regulator [Nevskia sp.]